MTVRTAIEKSIGKNIKLGGDTGFVYATMCTDETMSIVEQISNDEVATIKRRLKNLREVQPESKIKLHQKNERIKLYKKLLEEFEPILDREVKEVYKSILGDGIIIIFEGATHGKYWTRNEYETGMLGSVKKRYKNRKARCNIKCVN